MLIRVTTYVTDLGAMPAGLAISRIKGARHGVSYLDEGFGSLVDSSGGGRCTSGPGFLARFAPLVTPRKGSNSLSR
jgi:hypothetical protein